MQNKNYTMRFNMPRFIDTALPKFDIGFCWEKKGHGDKLFFYLDLDMC